MDDQALFVAFLRCKTERAILIRWLLAALQINHAVWSPKSFETIPLRAELIQEVRH
jgi:hypothetical protein